MVHQQNKTYYNNKHTFLTNYTESDLTLIINNYDYYNFNSG